MKRFVVEFLKLAPAEPCSLKTNVPALGLFFRPSDRVGLSERSLVEHAKRGAKRKWRAGQSDEADERVLQWLVDAPETSTRVLRRRRGE